MAAALFLRSEEGLCPDIQLPSGCQVNSTKTHNLDQKEHLPCMKDIFAGDNRARTFDRVERQESGKETAGSHCRWGGGSGLLC